MRTLAHAGHRGGILTVVGIAAIVSCGPKSSTGPEAPQALKKEVFGKMADGRQIDIYTLGNAKGMSVRITNYGGAVVSLVVPDKTGKPGDVVLGFDALDGYLQQPPPPYFGALIGRYGNRIAKGRFTLNGTEYKLVVNNGENHLHGGLVGFDKVAWNARDVSTADMPALELTYTAKDGEEGYPGNLAITVVYSVTANNELKIDYSATTDKDTVVNLTNHSYFNLAGQGEGDILGHVVTIDADRFTPVDKGLIPKGELRPVEGTPFDFRKPVAIGARINQDDEQLKLGGGYDHNWVLNHSGTLAVAARVTEPGSGRVMEVLTVEPGLQFYTGNFLDGTLKGGKGGKTYPKRAAFCMETQHFPDSPNKPSFPTTVLKPGEKYHTTTVYRFSTN